MPFESSAISYVITFLSNSETFTALSNLSSIFLASSLIEYELFSAFIFSLSFLNSKT